MVHAMEDRASFGTRLIAAIIDGVLVGVVSGTLRLFGIPLLGLVIGLAYSIYLEGSPSGQTIGKRAMNIRVIDPTTGGSIGYGRAAIRYVGRIISAIPLGLGYFWMLWDPDKQCWHDKMAADAVVLTSAYPVDVWPG
jgi:uncharacterized RDD family membrane protein YckC